MGHRYTKTIFSILVWCLMSVISMAQVKYDSVVSFNKIEHNFGDILESDGPVSCTFEITNISTKPLQIQNVLSSCGCTRAEWTKSSIGPGETGKIVGTFSNDQGPYAFDKSLTVYLSLKAKPVILHLRGNVMEKKLPLSELYKVRFGQIGLKSSEIKSKNLVQGQQKSGEETIANLGDTEATVTFEEVSPNLSIRVFPNPIKPGTTSKLVYTVTSSRDTWGKKPYYATPVVNGKSEGKSGKICVWAVTVDDFSANGDASEENSPMLEIVKSSFDAGTVKPGKVVKAEFQLFNYGGKDLKIYDAFSDTKGVTIKNLPVVKAGTRETFYVEFDTSNQAGGEMLATISLVTNSPLRPIANVHIVGILK